jgi:hypothetical protein
MASDARKPQPIAAHVRGSRIQTFFAGEPAEEIKPVIAPPPGSVIVPDDFRQRPQRCQTQVLLIRGRHQQRTAVPLRG